MSIPNTRAGRVGLGLTFTAATVACTDPVVGEWELVRKNQTPFPLVYNYYGCTYTVSVNVSVDEDFDAEMVTYYRGCGYQYTSVAIGSVEETEKRHYDAEFFIPDSGNFLTLECEMDKSEDVLECRSDTYDIYVLERGS